ncbi:hypothetical protein DQ226_10450 [Dietzia maris]|uniref:Serine/threonine protein kinase n=1 Tax=Dietzia maris TaxID=37915 RepID=A0A365P9E3_9ACTN|nr:hypothetical protein DQ226_10450 [Dietzia maris]
MVAFIALLSILALALIGAIGYLVLRPGGVSGDGAGQVVAGSSSSSTSTASSPPPVTETAYTTAPERETVTVTREVPAARSPRTAGYPAGADSSGWIDNSQSRCNAGDPAEMIGRTTQASFSICINPDNGRYYYRGSSGGAGVEIDDPGISGGSAMVASNDVLYSIDSSGMQIYQGGELISSQPMVSFWSE